MSEIPHTKIVKTTVYLAMKDKYTMTDLEQAVIDHTRALESCCVLSLESVELVLSEKPDLLHTEETPADLPPEEEPPKKAKKSKRGRPTTVSKRTKKAMNELKKTKKPFTGKIFGWNAEDDQLVPNWKEQQIIDWINVQLKEGQSGAEIGRILTNCKVPGKRGGKTWNSSGVLRTARNPFHKSRKDFSAPQYFTWTMKRPYHPATDY